jgi:hypothetical protein
MLSVVRGILGLVMGFQERNAYITVGSNADKSLSLQNIN